MSNAVSRPNKQTAPVRALPTDALAREGYLSVDARSMRELLLQFGPLFDWSRFVASWDDLRLDNYMADRGRYRLRRYAVYVASPDRDIERQPHQPHYQALDYNPLNGGIARWFEPVADDIGNGPSMCTILNFCRTMFDSMVSRASAWNIEVHQFRIEARPGEPGLPTPEGMHRDGVDYVLVLLVRRQNIASGTTVIGTFDGCLSSSFTLKEPFDAALVDDARVYHGVTPVAPIDPTAPAYRDVLVVTFKRLEAK